MEFYTPIFSKIVDSSLWCEPDYVVKVFLTMLAKKDRDNVVRGNAFTISQWSKKSEKETLDALNILSSPDTKRLEPQPFEGRRIERVEDGWKILNGKYYQDLMGTINRRTKKAIYEKNRRERLKKQAPSGTETRYVEAFGNGEVDKADKIVAENLPEHNNTVNPTETDTLEIKVNTQHDTSH